MRVAGADVRGAGCRSDVGCRGWRGVMGAGMAE